MRNGNSLKVKIGLNETLFWVSYTMFYISLFVFDIEQNSYDFAEMGNLLRYISFLVMIMGVCFRKIYKRNFVFFLLLLAFSAIMFIETNATYFIAVVLLCILSQGVDNQKILRYTFSMLLILTLGVILAQMFGIFENVITYRWGRAGGGSARYSFGFYHSNVLPLISSYLFSYFLLIKNRISKKMMLFVLGVSFIIYRLCGSRNAIIVTIIMLILIVVFNANKEAGKRQKILNFIARYSTGVLAILCIVLASFVGKNSVVDAIDYLMTYRLTYGQIAINNYGIKLINFMDSYTYTSLSSSVIDNGYIYVTVRYGLLIILALAIAVYSVIRKYNNPMVSIVAIGISFINMMDNDILDYLCLPLLIIVIRECISLKLKKT